MKKTNKIVPLALCASVAMVAPITISCNNQQTSTHKEDLESLYKNGYKRQIEALPSTTSLTDPTTVYLEAINKNPMLLADDVFDYEGNFPPITEKIPTFDDTKGSVTVSAATADVKNKTITYSKQIAVKAPLYYVDTHESVIKAIVDLNITIDVVNLPVNVYGTGSFVKDEVVNYYWFMIADNVALAKDGWSIMIDGKYNIDFGRTTSDGDISLQLTNKGGYAWAVSLLTYLLPNVVCYFKNISNIVEVEYETN